MTAVPRYAKAIVDIITADHPYRDSIRGDLEEEFALRAAGAGTGPARTWYRAEAIRTAVAMLRSIRLTPGGTGRILAVVFAAYLGVLAVDRIGSYAVWRERALLAPIAVRGVMLAWILCTGASAGYAVTRFARRPPVVSILAFLVLALGIGTHYVAVAEHHEVWIRMVKVAVLLVAATIGAVRAGVLTRTA